MPLKVTFLCREGSVLHQAYVCLKEKDWFDVAWESEPRPWPKAESGWRENFFKRKVHEFYFADLALLEEPPEDWLEWAHTGPPENWAIYGEKSDEIRPHVRELPPRGDEEYWLFGELEALIGKFLLCFHAEILRDYVQRKWEPYLQGEDAASGSDGVSGESLKDEKTKAIQRFLFRDPTNEDELGNACRVIRSYADELMDRIDRLHEKTLEPPFPNQEGSVAEQVASRKSLLNLFEEVALLTHWKRLIPEFAGEERPDPTRWREAMKKVALKPLEELDLASPAFSAHIATEDDAILELALLKLCAWRMELADQGNPGEWEAIPEGNGENGVGKCRYSVTVDGATASFLDPDTDFSPDNLVKWQLRSDAEGDRAMRRSHGFVRRQLRWRTGDVSIFSDGGWIRLGFDCDGLVAG